MVTAVFESLETAKSNCCRPKAKGGLAKIEPSDARRSARIGLGTRPGTVPLPSGRSESIIGTTLSCAGFHPFGVAVMAIEVHCRCGAGFLADSHLAGKRVQCPSCGAPLAIPAPPSAASPSVVVACRCGRRFSAEARLFGKSVRCPSCGAGISVPDPASPRTGNAPAPSKPSPDPFWDDVLPAASETLVSANTTAAPRGAALGAIGASRLAKNQFRQAESRDDMAFGLRLAFLEIIFTVLGGVVEGAVILSAAKIREHGIYMPDGLSDGALALLLGLFDLPGQFLALGACVACLRAAYGKAKGVLIGALASRAIGTLVTVFNIIGTASGSVNYEEFASCSAVFDWCYRLLFLFFLCGVERSMKPKAKTNQLESFQLILFFGGVSVLTGMCLIVLLARGIAPTTLGCAACLWVLFSFQYMAFLWRLSRGFAKHTTR